MKELILNNLKKSTKNLKSNFILLISSIALIALHLLTKELLIAQIVSFVLIFITFSQINDLFGKTKNINKFLKALAITSTIGIVYYIRFLFIHEATNFDIIVNFFAKNNLDLVSFLDKFSYILMIVSSLILYTVIALLFEYLSKLYKNLFSDLAKSEKIVYPIFIVVILLFVSIVFIKTDVFYGARIPMDTIFTSDSGVLVDTNAYMRLYHIENDIRQPLSAVFAMPFIGIGYALSLAFPVFDFIQPLFVNYIQIILLIFSNFIIAKLLKLRPSHRILFVILSMCTFMNILFLFTMEQYIIAYFWMITLIYSICNNSSNALLLTGAGGTLITTLFFTLWVPTEFSIKKIKNYILDLIKAGFSFLYFLLIFGRMDIFFLKTILFKSNILGGFVDKDITLLEKTKQYTEFIKNCFIAPNTVVTTTTLSTMAYQLDTITQFSILGIIIFILAIIGFIVSRKEKISQLSFAWLLFSSILLCVVGWGAVENGMILYSLYFGWAFLVLIFQLIKKLSEKIKIKYLLEISIIIFITTLLIFNIQGTKDLLDFAFTYFGQN